MQADTRHPLTTVPHASKHYTWQKPSWSPYKDSQASSNSTHRNSILSGKAASTHTLQDISGAFLQNSTRRIRILSKRVKYCIYHAVQRYVYLEIHYLTVSCT